MLHQETKSQALWFVTGVTPCACCWSLWARGVMQNPFRRPMASWFGSDQRSFQRVSMTLYHEVGCKFKWYKDVESSNERLCHSWWSRSLCLAYVDTLEIIGGYQDIQFNPISSLKGNPRTPANCTRCQVSGNLWILGLLAPKIGQCQPWTKKPMGCLIGGRVAIFWADDITIWWEPPYLINLHLPKYLPFETASSWPTLLPSMFLQPESVHFCCR